MEFLHASIALLASMVLVLAGMVGWLYWQQTRLFQNMNSIVMVIGELARPPSQMIEEVTHQPEAPQQEEDDDRVSVVEEEELKTKVETISGPPEPIDTDSLDGKSKKELMEMLSKRGIPYAKNETKSGLISALKATA